MVFEIMQEIKDLAGMTPFPCYCAPFTLASHVTVSAAGNAVGTGARVALLNKSARMEIEDLVRRVEKLRQPSSRCFSNILSMRLRYLTVANRFPICRVQ